jgi:hypothetical protein
MGKSFIFSALTVFYNTASIHHTVVNTIFRLLKNTDIDVNGILQNLTFYALHVICLLNFL